MKYITVLFSSIFLLLFIEINSQTIWDGPPVTFIKADFTDWNLEENQDRITPTVWLTRKDEQGQFNIAQETGYSNGSPTDTEWGWGTTADISSITFYNWKGATNTNNPYGDHENISDGPLVLHLITDDIYIDLQYNSWTSQGGGGFSYTRSSDPALSINDFENKSLKIYPNPTKDFINIKNLKENQTLKIYDILGKNLIDIKYNADKAIDVSSLEKGIYYLKFENNQITRFIKK